ncbi:unnamed protein product [Didymodactylos carnosus]|uniref:Uncharacterized protein n=1 Tax=Didymodactylos carnosus TaxID=1234261 RepID=A0A814XSQ7_9BILA|nr:unnamed protein product [Didymodactylos carnosus]CAF3983371.1 unnamed protein product [Didymodactylos carnosus]
MQPVFEQEHAKAIAACAYKIAQASILLQSSPMGIGYLNAQELGTGDHVFAIPVPHTGYYYGHICIVFKHDLMLHPD